MSDEINNKDIGNNNNVSGSAEKRVEELIKKANKEYGEGYIVSLASSKIADLVRCSTGFLSLDEITGGGFPYGRIIEIYGQESSGKTTLALHAIAEVQKRGGIALFIDAEHALNPNYIDSIGVNRKRLIFSQPSSGEEALKMVMNYSNECDIIVVDSVASLTPQAEIDAEISDSQIALQARLLSKGLRMIVDKPFHAIIIFINQLRVNPNAYGIKEVTSGGNALKFYSSIRLEIRRGNSGDLIKKGEEIIGIRNKLKTVKNKVASPYQSCSMNIIFGKGFDRNADALDMAVKYGIIKKSGSWYEYKNKKIGQGSEAAIKFLKDNQTEFDDIYNEITKKIKENSGENGEH